MAQVKFKRIEDSSNINNLPIIDGQITYTKDGKTYLDYETERVPVNGTPDTTMSDVSTNAIANNVVKSYIDNNIQNVSGNIHNGTILYSNDSGSTGDITLNDSAGNYDIIEIYYKNNNSYNGYSKIYNPNGKNIVLSLAFPDASQSQIWVQSSVKNISGTSITNLSNRVAEAEVYSKAGYGTNARIAILKVIGYNTGLFD